jgi:hypothetical protein
VGNPDASTLQMAIELHHRGSQLEGMGMQPEGVCERERWGRERDRHVIAMVLTLRHWP